MGVDTSQEETFLDSLMEVPKSELDVPESMIDWQAAGRKLRGIKGDYKAVSMFKMMLLQTWHNLSNVSVCNAIKGMVESVFTTPANESEMTNFSEVVKQANLKSGQKVLYDKEIDSKSSREFLKQQKLQDGIMRTKNRKFQS